MRRPLWLAAAAAAAIWLVTSTRFGDPGVESNAQPYTYDYAHYYRPNAEYLGTRLARGELPLWNPQQAVGGPFLATLQPGALYPPNWLHALLPAQTAFALLAALHIALAAAFAGALARALGAGAPGALASALLYATSLKLFGNVWNPPTLYAAAWVPAVVLGVDRVVARPVASNAVALAAALAAQALSGWPYTLAMTALGAGLYGLALLARDALARGRPPLRALAWLAAACGIGLGLAAPQLLPAAELVARSVRALGSIVEAQAIFVDALHEPSRFFGRLLRQGLTESIPGVFALLLACGALRRRGADRLRAWALFGVGALALCASFPNHLPVYAWLRELPLLGDFRFPFRYRLLTLLAVSVLAGVGITRLAAALAARPRLARAATAAAIAAAFAPRVLSAPGSGLAFPLAASPLPSPAERLVRYADVSPGVFHRVYWADRIEKSGGSEDLHVLYDLEPLTLERTAAMFTFFLTGRPNTLVPPRRRVGPRERERRASAPYTGQLHIPPSAARAGILDVLSADLIAARDTRPWLDRRYERLSPLDAPEAVFANPHALPHAYRVHAAEPEPGERRRALERLVERDFDPRTRVLLDEVPALLAREGGGGEEESAPAFVRVERYEPEWVQLRTAGARPGVVVLTDAYFPGWEATVDGAPARIHRANTLFRAVEVPAGEHLIEMRYRPRSLRVGFSLAVAAALAGCFCIFGRPLASRRSVSRPQSTSA